MWIMNLLYNLKSFSIEMLCFKSYFYCYSATNGPISIKLYMAVKGYLTRFDQLS